MGRQGRDQLAELLPKVINQVPIILWSADIHGIIQLADGKGLSHVGLHSQDFVGKSIFDVFLNYPVVCNGARKALQGHHDTHHVEIRGVHFESSLTPLLDDQGCVTGIVGISVDITERKRAEKSQKQLTTMFNQAAVGMAQVTPQGKCLKANQKLCEMLGYSEQELMEITVKEITHPEDYEKDLTLVQRTLAGEIDHYSLEKRYFRKDGSIVWTNLSVTLARDANSEPEYIIAVIEDIHSRKQSESELRKVEQDRAEMAMREKAAQEASRLKSEFLANMSHEIRTPLNGVTGMTSLLMGTTLDLEQRDYVESIQRSSETLLSVINDILDFSKVEAGRLELEHLNFDLNQLLQDTYKTFLHSARTKGLELILETQSSFSTPYRGDPNRIRQVLTNLMSNAIKFTEHGQVTMIVRCEPPIESKMEGPDWVCFEIRDTGIGIPSSSIPRLFHSFSQADPSTTRKFGGTGLGLSICKKLVTLMQGSIELESQEGVGSRFWFSIPLEKGAIHLKTQVQPFNSDLVLTDQLKGKRILLAEDNLVNQMVAVRQLQKLGIEIEAVGNGKEALHALKDKHYDLILMDCQMPELDGYETTRLIRNSEISDERDIPIVAMTANAIKGDRERCLEIGMNDYVSKPINLHSLVEVLQKWMVSSSASHNRGI